MITRRQLDIVEHLAIRYEVEVGELSDLLDVSPSTIRRELRLMEREGLVVRTHGAARLRVPIHYDPPYSQRAARQLDEKRAIALAAMQLISPGMILSLMGGTTCTRLARLLRYVEDLTIVTNAVNIAVELYGQSNKRVMVTGGTLNDNSYELIGSQTISSLGNVHCEVAIIGASGLSVGYGLSMSDEPEAAVGRALMGSAERTIVLADHTKLGVRGLARVCPLDQVHTLVTDSQADLEKVQPFVRAGLEVVVADPSPMEEDTTLDGDDSFLDGGMPDI